MHAFCCPSLVVWLAHSMLVSPFNIPTCTHTSIHHLFHHQCELVTRLVKQGAVPPVCSSYLSQGKLNSSRGGKDGPK